MLKESGSESVAFLNFKVCTESNIVLPGQLSDDHFSYKHIKGVDFYSDVCLTLLTEFCKKDVF